MPTYTSQSGNVTVLLLDGGLRGEMGPAGFETDASSSAKGVVRLSGDLSGTASSPTVPGLMNKVSKGEIIVNVKDFGAVGDGVTDDTLSIQAAIDSISQSSISPNTLSESYRYGGTVLLPKGKYRTTSTIYIPAFTTLQGRARVGFGNLNLPASTSPGSVIYYDPPADNKNTYAISSGNFVVSTGLRKTDGTRIRGVDIDNGIYSEARDVGLFHLTIQAASTGITGGLLMNGAANSQVEDVAAKGFLYGVDTSACWSMKLGRIHTESNEAAAIGLRLGGDSNGVVVNGAYCTTNQTDGTAYKFSFATSCVLNGLIAEKSYIGFYEESCRSMTYIGGYAEKIDGSIILLDDSLRPRFTGINSFSTSLATLVTVKIGVVSGVIESFTGTVNKTFALDSSTPNSAFVQIAFINIEPTANDNLALNNSSKVSYIKDLKNEYYAGTQYRKVNYLPAIGAEWYAEARSFTGTTKYEIRYTPDGYGLYDWNSGSLRMFFYNTGNKVEYNNTNLTFTGSTGSKIASTSTEKMAFWGSTPVVQQTGSIVSALGTIGIVASPTLYQQEVSTPVVTKTATYSITASDVTVLADATSSGFTLTLPAAGGVAGRWFIVKKIDGTANIVTIGTTSSQTIEGVTTRQLTAQWSSLMVQSDGTNWITIAKEG